MHPSVGNHEYHTPGAAGYFDYFGTAAGPRDKGYYSFDIGAWHLVALNSNCTEIGGCEEGSVQEQWLRADLAASSASCTFAYWHHPRFSSGTHGSDPRMAAIWQALYDYGADVVLSGHDHNYQRFAPQTADGAADAQGRASSSWAQEVGVNIPPGRRSRTRKHRVRTRLACSSSRSHPTSYEWQFVPETGGTFSDSGSATCVRARDGKQPTFDHLGRRRGERLDFRAREPARRDERAGGGP